MAIRRHIFLSFWEGKRQLTTWILLSEKHIRNSITGRISKVPSMHDSRYRSHPRHGYRRALSRNRSSEIRLLWQDINVHTAWVTTTVLAFTAATLVMSSSVRPGRAKVVRSRPSVSQSAFKPTIAMTPSASLARSTAC